MSSGAYPPGSSHGKYFVTDPSLLNTNDIKTQITLLFKTRIHKEVLATRTYHSHIANRSKKHEMKATEQFLETKSALGERENFNLTILDFEKEVALLLGASKAVLENVIFCHQEDSLWPFSDNSKLKKIFDELFETSELQEKIEICKKVKKKIGNENMAEMFKIEHDLKLFNDSSIKSIQAIQGMSTINKENENANDIEEAEINLIKIRSEISTITYRIKTLENQINVDGTNFEFENSLEELEELYKALDIRLKELQDEKFRYDLEVNSGERKISDLEQEISNNEEFTFFEKSLNQAYITSKTQIKEILGSFYHDKDENLPTAISKYLLEINPESRNYEIQLKEKELRSNEEQLNNLQIDIGDLESKLKISSENLNFLSQFINEETSASNLFETISNEVNNRERQSISLSQQYTDILNLIQTRKMEREITKKEFGKLQETPKDIIGSIEIKSILEDLAKNQCIMVTDVSNIDNTSINSVYSYFENEIEKLSNDIHTMTIDRLHLKASNEQSRNQTSNLISLINESQNQLIEINMRTSGVLERIGIKASDLQKTDLDIDSIVNKYKEELQLMKKQKIILDYKKHQMYDEIREYSEKKKRCEICGSKMFPDVRNKSPLPNSNNKPKISVSRHSSIASCNFSSFCREGGDIDTKIDILKEKVKLLKNHQNELKTKINLLQNLENNENEKAKIEQNINLRKEAILNYEEFEANKQNLIKEFKNTLSLVKEKLNSAILKKHNGLNENIKQQFEILNSFDLGIKDLELTLNEVEKEGHLNEKIKNEQKERLEKLKLIPNELITVNINDLKNEILNINSNISELKSIQSNLLNETTSLQRQIQNLRFHFQSELDDYKSKEGKLSNLLNKVTETNAKLSESNSRESFERIKKMNHQKMEIKNQVSVMKTSLFDIENKISTIILRRNELDKGIKIKKIEKDFDILNEKLQSLENEKSKFERNLKISQMTKKRLIEDSFARNSIEERKKIEFENYKKQYIENENANINKILAERIINLKCKTSAIIDLDLHIKAMENSLFKFHKLKMDQINEIIKNLWEETYEGNDIKKIEIKSEIESISQIKKTQTYNYRIVFFNHKKRELDMRGRSSMGQKVLASIIIRLALAEAFGLNCGVFALDEPTTNLDKAHIHSLAKQIRTLIDYRKQMVNFQMIIISHDKDFISSLSEYTNQYYKVYKDPETMFSKIEKKSFN